MLRECPAVMPPEPGNLAKPREWVRAGWFGRRSVFGRFGGRAFSGTIGRYRNGSRPDFGLTTRRRCGDFVSSGIATEGTNLRRVGV